MLRRVVGAVAILMAAVVGCTPDSEPPGLLLRKETFGDAWPLTVDSVRVDCIGIAAVAYHEGQTYALNGAAMSQGYARIEPLWRWNPENEGYRINIHPLIESALAQCSE